MTPMINHVETCRNKVAVRIDAIAIERRTRAKGRDPITKNKVAIVENRLAGTRKEQIATQLLRENSQMG